MIPAIGSTVDRSPSDRQSERIGCPVSDRAVAIGAAQLRAFRRAEPERGQATAWRGKRGESEGSGGGTLLGRGEVEATEKR